MKNKKIVIGTWPLSGDFGTVPLSEVEKVFKASKDLGFDEFDTAPNYGNGFAEQSLGKFFGKDAGIKINTKFGSLPFGGKNFEIKSLEESFNQSLKRLQRENVHVLFLHNPRSEVKGYSEILGLFEKLKKAGKIAHSGISLAKDFPYTENDLNSFDVVQDDFNLLRMNFFDIHPGFKKIFYARSPLATGILSGKLTADSIFAVNDHRSGWLKGERLGSILARVERIRKITLLPLPELARRFLFTVKKVNSVIFGVKKVEHIQEIVQTPDAALDEATMAAIKKLYDSDFELTGQKHLGF